MANQRTKRVGTVVRDANDKTIVVAYTWSQRHRLYKRHRRRVTKFVAHDENNEASIGDRVEIEECRPYSATKRWRLRRIIAQVDVVASTEAPEVISETDVPLDDTVDDEPTETVDVTDAVASVEDESDSEEPPSDETEVTESQDDVTESADEVSDEPQVDDAPAATAADQQEKTP